MCASILLIVTFFLPPALPWEPSLHQLRSLYLQAPVSERSCFELLRAADKAASPLTAGYKGAAMMIAAKYFFNPLTKLRYFRKGKNLLQTAVRTDSTSVELHFLRYTIQVNAPGFLGYRDDITADNAFILLNLKKISDPELSSMIYSNLSAKGIK